ncbi:MAG: S1 RNA-binding domain-containing protein [Candidatus Shikimatogenerans bostrichidophilus]|nr:MAG: S1 RNA-binding domain-containing protein [Candidatus Shikimatogenerans bostrichidophilus]
MNKIIYNNKINPKILKIINKYIKNIKNINELEIYKGKIINILDDYVIIDFGYKFEGIIPLNEFKKKKIKIGDIKDIMVIKLDYNGNCLLSYEKANIYKSWLKIQDDYKNNNTLKGYVISRTKGGFIINLYNKISSFLPGSHTDIKAIKDYDYYVGKNIDVKILNINLKTKNIIVSHKILIEKDIKDQKNKLLLSLKIGQIIEGKVKNLISYGAFIDLGEGLDGLLHITDISWKKIDNPSEILTIGKKYKFIILEIDKEKSRLQLGYKQLKKHPWDLIKNKLKIGDLIKGKINKITDYGAFLELDEGIEGLLHVSEMSWDNQLKTAKDFVKLNDKLKCLIINIDKKEKKIFLSLKRLLKDPWKEIIKKYTINNIYEGTIIKFLKNNYGLKIELEKNLYGILLNYEMSWYHDIENLSKKYKIGDKIKIKIISIDVDMRKIYLGHKQIKDNKWNKYKKIYKINSIHFGKIKKIYKNGIILKNFKHKFLNFFIPYRLIKKKNYKIKEVIKFKILEINIKYKKIIVTPNLEKKVYNKKHYYEKSTFGDLNELIIIKKKIEEEERKNKNYK